MNRIYIFTEVYFPEDFRINEVAEYLSDKTEIYVITRVPSYPRGKLRKGFKNIFQQEDKGKIKIFRYPIWLNYDDKKLHKLLNLFWQPIVLLYYYFRFRPERVFIFQTGSLYQYLFLMFKLKRTKILLWSQDLWPEAGYSINENLVVFNKLFRWLTKSILESSNGLLVQSEAFSEHYYSHYAIQSKVLNNFSPVSLHRGVRTNKENNLVYAGNIGSAQGLGDLIEMYKRIQNEIPGFFSSFDIYGDGSLLEEIKASCESIEDVRFHGRVSRDILDMEVLKAKFVCLRLLDSALNKTIPSRFQYFYNMGCQIIYLGSGEVQRITERTKCGIAINSIDDNSLIQKLINYQAVDNRLDLYNKQAILDKLDCELKHALE
jgi:colanic acid biosynthesis glycosyl transferase WcaI